MENQMASQIKLSIKNIFAPQKILICRQIAALQRIATLQGMTQWSSTCPFEYSRFYHCAKIVDTSFQLRSRTPHHGHLRFLQYFVLIVRATSIVQHYLQDKCGQHENNSTQAMYLDRLGYLLNNLKTSSQHTVKYQQAFIETLRNKDGNTKANVLKKMNSFVFARVPQMAESVYHPLRSHTSPSA